MSRMTRCFSGVVQGAATLGALGLIVIAVLVSLDVSVRFFIGRPIAGVFEIASVLLVAVTFLPMAAVLLTRQQLRVDIVLEQVRGRARSALGLLDSAVGLLVFGILFQMASEEFLKAYLGRFLLRGLVEIPSWIPISMICLGAFLSLLTLLVQAFQALRHLLGGEPPAENVVAAGPVGPSNGQPEAR